MVLLIDIFIEGYTCWSTRFTLCWIFHQEINKHSSVLTPYLVRVLIWDFTPFYRTYLAAIFNILLRFVILFGIRYSMKISNLLHYRRPYFTIIGIWCDTLLSYHWNDWFSEVEFRKCQIYKLILMEGICEIDELMDYMTCLYRIALLGVQ